MATTFFAHTPDGQIGCAPTERWQPLAEHLLAVARLAAEYARDARPLRAGESPELQHEKEAFHFGAYWAGLLHDLGKYRPEFQKMLLGRHARNHLTHHKQAGAAMAYQRGRADLSFAIAGHHGGIPDKSDLENLLTGPGGLDVAASVQSNAFADCPALSEIVPTWQPGKDVLLFDVVVRLLFSCLVDADWKDTGDFHRRAKGLPPEIDPPALDPLSKLANTRAYIHERSQQCREPRIAAIRHEVLEAALHAADEAPGLFALTVPTGGGKTLSALAFALAHAARHDLRRIIYVAPYLSIIEQNASEIRRALRGDDDSDFVFEHHSLSEPPVGNPEEAQSEERARRAENWESPVVVTTNVQFFESLFSNRPGQCRKLHNIARGVVILDECQTLPPDLITPTCSMLGRLAQAADCTIVLCTVTQPAWAERPDLPDGLAGVREIVSSELKLFDRLRRVQVQWPVTGSSAMDWSEIAGEMAKHQASLCIVNTKRAAREVFVQLCQRGCGDALHLSTSMCPAHRLEVLAEVRRRLQEGDPCRLVSTQLIEAGVDVDFPVVLREMAPLEAIIQSAGRCNREGLLNSPEGGPGGKVIVFRSCEGRLPPDRWYRSGIDTLEQAFLHAGREPDVSRTADMQEYFQRLYHTGDLDQQGIQELRKARGFASVAEKYRLIDEQTSPVVALTWEQRRSEIEALLEALRRHPTKRLFRRLGRFQVNLRPDELASAGGQVIEDPGGVLTWMGAYDDHLGISSANAQQLLAV